MQQNFDLTTLNGVNGFVINGINANDQLGRSVGTAGDVNGNGIDDLLLGAWQASPGGRINAGIAYVLYGQASGWPATFDLSTLTGSNGFAINGLNAGGWLGDSVATAGDVNGDGFSDMLLGAYLSSPKGLNMAGTVYILFGKAGGRPAGFDLTTLTGTNGFAINGLGVNDQLGDFVGSAGDVNGDGLSDVVMGAVEASPIGRANAGTVYVLFGQTSGWPASFNLATLTGNNGFAISGVNAGDRLGVSVSTAGDINGDGKVDLMMGAFMASPGGRINAGTVYVLFGQASGWPAAFDLTTLNGSNGFAIEGINAGDQLGWGANTAGDINGDGKADLIFAARQASPGGRTNAGKVYVLLGQGGSGWPARFDLGTLNGLNGFVIDGISAGDGLGQFLNMAGDMNGDGLSDLVLGASQASPAGRSGAGSAYVLFGQRSGWSARFDLRTLTGGNGFSIWGTNAGDRLGRYVNTAGDINRDGLSDLVLGASHASPAGRSGAGSVYVIFGVSTPTPTPTPTATPAPTKPTPTPTPTPTPVSPPTSTADATTLVSTTSTFTPITSTTGTTTSISTTSTVTPTPLFSPTPTPIGINTKPVIVNNQLSVTQGKSVILTSANLSAKDDGVNDIALVFYMDNVQHGRFERLTGLGIAITQFTQQEIMDQQIRFVPDGSVSAPAYEVIVSNGRLASLPQTAQINFTQTATPAPAAEPVPASAPTISPVSINTPPIVIQNPDDQDVTVGKDFSFSFGTNRIFRDNEGDALTFSMRRWNDTWPSWLTFDANSTAVTFKGIATTAGAAVVGLLATDSYNATSGPANFSIRAFNPGIPAPAIVNTPGPLLPPEFAWKLVVGLGAAVAIGIGIGFWAKKKEKGCFAQPPTHVGGGAAAAAPPPPPGGPATGGGGVAAPLTRKNTHGARNPRV